MINFSAEPFTLRKWRDVVALENPRYMKSMRKDFEAPEHKVTNDFIKNFVEVTVLVQTGPFQYVII